MVVSFSSSEIVGKAKMGENRSLLCIIAVFIYV